MGGVGDRTGADPARDAGAAGAGHTRSGMLGGTFDPPHLAHFALAAAARHALRLDRVLFVPAGDPWRKRNRHGVTAATIRLDLVRAATAPLAWAEVSEIEVRREGPSYTTDTIEALARDGSDWWFILGADALADMPYWHEPERIVRAARLALARRPLPDGEGAGAGAGVPDALRRLVPDIEERIDTVPLPPLEISSTDLRERVRDGRPTEFLLPEGVRALIDEYGLYR